jgi:CheY-like chemotaxis protein
MEQCAILHVEDDDAAAFLFRLALDQAEIPVSVYRVSDGGQALDFLRKTGCYEKARTPALLVLDLNMPRIDGWAILAERQKDHALKTIPVIVLSTAPACEARPKALAAGAQYYLEKPFEFDQLVQEVKMHCKPFLSSASPMYFRDETSAESFRRMDTALRQQERSGIAKISSC